MNADSPHVLWFEKVGRGDVAKVGGKNASLGEMVAKLAKQGVRVPPGFATTADAYWRYRRGQWAEAEDHRRAGQSRRRQGILAGNRRRDPRHVPEGRISAGDGASDPRGLCRAVQARRQGGCRRRGTLERHRRGSAGRQFRRPAGDLPQYPRRRRAARRLPALLRVPFHRPRHQLPPRQGLRSYEGGALDRRAAHGALRYRRLRRDVLDRYRDRLRQSGADQRRLGPGRERRAGRCRPGRIRRVQAAAVEFVARRRSSRRHAARRRRR